MLRRRRIVDVDDVDSAVAALALALDALLSGVCCLFVFVFVFGFPFCVFVADLLILRPNVAH